MRKAKCLYQSCGYDIDEEHFRLLSDSVSSGVIHELTQTDAGLLGEHFTKHSNTIFIAISGITAKSNWYPFQSGESLLAVERIREKQSQDGTSLTGIWTASILAEHAWEATGALMLPR